MGGFIGNDGSELAGALNPSSQVQGLQVDNSGNLKVNATVTPAANQRVNAQSGDFVAGSIVDLATLAAIVSSNKAAVKAAANDIVDLATLAGIVSANKAAVKAAAGDFADLATLAGIVSGAKAAVKASSGDFPAGSITDLATLAGGISSNKYQVNLAQVLGSALSLTNPVITEDQVRAAILAGQAYQASVFQTTAAGITVAAALVNLSGSGKNVLVYSVKEFNAGGLSNFTVRLQTSDPALGNTITPVNSKAGGAAAVASFEYVNTTQTPSGTTIDNINSPSNTETQILQNGSCILLPAGSTNTLILYPVITGSSNWGVTMKWLEF